MFARDLKITPVSSDWTEFYVTRASGSIQILARKNDVTVNCGTNSSATVKQGQQISRDDSGDCGLLAKPGNGAATAAKGPAFDSRWVQIGGLGAGGALLGWVLLHGDNPVSPLGPVVLAVIQRLAVQNCFRSRKQSDFLVILSSRFYSAEP